MKSMLLLFGLLSVNACTTLSAECAQAETETADDEESSTQDAHQIAVLEAIENFKK